MIAFAAERVKKGDTATRSPRLTTRGRSSSTPPRKNASTSSANQSMPRLLQRAKYLPLVRKAKDGSWIDGFLAFRDDFEFAQPAQRVMAAFAELRKTQDVAAQKAFGEAASFSSRASKTKATPSTRRSFSRTTLHRSTASSSARSRRGSSHYFFAPGGSEVRNASRSRTAASPSIAASPTGMIEVPLGRICSSSARRITVERAFVSVTRIALGPSARTRPTTTCPSLVATVNDVKSGSIDALGAAMLR